HTRFSRDWSSDVCSSDLRICYNNDTIVQVGCILVFFMNLKFATLFSVSKCGNKGTVGGIKIVQKTLMKGQAGTNQSRNYRLIGKVLDWRHPQWSFYVDGFVFKCLADFVCHDFP